MGPANAEIARWTGTSRLTVVDWHAHYDAGNTTARHDRKGSDRPLKIDDVRAVVAILAEDERPPAPERQDP